ncbi:MAG: carboxypeptidase-like regulatory domain-containing protein [Bacteroidales bacterium]|nr:carboxypeptidase-like regulatory domain-containing protein [Bacteroidales bacterium]
MKTLNRLFITVLSIIVLMLVSFEIYAQAQVSNFVTVSGIVKDAKSHEPIAFASISLTGTDIGTVSNSDGEFSLKVGTAQSDGSIEISHLSYVSGKFGISASTGENKVFYLDPHVFMLKEISIIPDDPRSIVMMALGKISKNYSDNPNMMTGFYRETIRQKKDYVSISEALVDIYKAPYTGYQNDQVRIIKGRNGSNVKKADTLMVQLQGGPNVALLIDIVKNLDLSISLNNLDNYAFELTTFVNIDDKPNYVISFRPNILSPEPLYYGKLFISRDNLAITRAEFSLDLQDEEKAARQFVQKKPTGLVFQPTSTSYLVTFNESGGKYYLNYVRIELKFVCDWKKRWFKNTYNIVSEVAITDRREENAVKFPNQDLFRSNMILADKIQSFTDNDFWGDYNIIEPEQSIQNAVKKFTKGLKK